MVDAAVEFLLNNLKELLVSHSHLITSRKSEIESLERDLRIFKAFLKDSVKKRRKDERIKELVRSIRDVVYEVEDVIDAFVTRSLPHKSEAGSVKAFLNFWERSTSLHRIGRKVEEVKKKVERARLEFATLTVDDEDDSEKPEMAHEALHSLLEILNHILKLSHPADIYQEIISIHDEAAVLQLHLKNIPDYLEEQIREATVALEEAIQSLFSEGSKSYGYGRSDKLSERLREAAEHFKSTAGDMVHRVNSKRRRLSDISPSVSSSSRTSTTGKDFVVGFDDDLEQIRLQLLRSLPSQLQVLSIVGTGGIGKTTLAKLVYNHEFIVNHFDIRAWITVSQDYNVGSILSNLLASLEREIPNERDAKEELSMASLIRRYLYCRRFLIVIDDMCSKKAWDDLKMVFPNTKFGGRIMLTTRLNDVAAYVDSSGPVHSMRLLNAHHSWNLLEKKVFVDESCPPELVDVGKQIVKNCGGLPLSIVVVAGILYNLPKIPHSWKQIAENHDNLEALISLSCNHLPGYTRACFIYMGGFPEDYEIHASELIKLWTAEGFIEFRAGSKSLEEVAAEVLENLVERNLVLVNRRKFDGKIKSCSLHDIVRDFCIREAQQEKFLLSVMDYLPTPILRRHFLPRLLKSYGRISVSSHDLDLKNYVHCSSTQSIICIPQGGYKCVGSMHKFSSLKVFHVLRRNSNWDWEPSQVLDLMDLNYLASNIPIIPSTISEMMNLQTLIIYRSDVQLPAEIWKLRRLRHLVALSFDSLPQPDGETLPLENLQVMSLVIDLMCSERMMEMIPNINKLGIRCRSSTEALSINNLGYLRLVEKLKLVSLEKLQYTYRWKIPIFPLSLKKLTLCGMRLLWEDMRIIGSLPSLQMLKLKNYAFHGCFWKTTEGQFRQLEFLLVDESYLAEWVSKSSHFPKLKSLVLHRCPCLREIPHDIGNISTLELIKIDACNEFLLKSAKIIQADQERKGNCKIQVCYSSAFSTKKWELGEDPNSSSIFEHLPDHLKQCFLYMAAFPKDYEIRASEIVKLWVAEGFLGCPTEIRSLEEEAKDCLDDLEQRGLILVISRKVDGRIKSCRLDNMMRDFCVREAVQHKFILPLNDYFPSPIVRRDFQRISASWYDLKDLKDSMHSSRTQTVICIPQEGFTPKGSLHDFTSLRVLHVLHRNYRSYWELDEVFDHIHLTYLASYIPSSIVPPAISKLQDLQTLIIYSHGVRLPVEIWRMPKLRHLIAFSFRPLPFHLMAFSFHPLLNPEAANLSLKNLHTLSSLTDFVCSQGMVVMIPNIKKLGLRYSEKTIGEYYQLDNLVQLRRLEKLKLEMLKFNSSWARHPVFPLSLKKLNLSSGRLPWRAMRIIGSLPNLQVLKLRNYACHGEEWKTIDGEFQQLRILHIDESNLQYWKTNSRHFPCLQWLILHRCPDLCEIPREIGRIPTLELIEVDEHNQYLLDFAKRIERELLKYGARKIEVRVKRF